MTANDSKSYLGYLNKLNGYNNIYHPSICKEPVNADYSVLTDEIESSHNVPKFKVGDRVRITKYKNIFSKSYSKNWSKEIWLILYWKLILGRIKLKI